VLKIQKSGGFFCTFVAVGGSKTFNIWKKSSIFALDNIVGVVLS
jgi:hypothetical protein